MKLTYTLIEALEKFSDQKETTDLFSIDDYRRCISIDNEYINFCGNVSISTQSLWSPYYYTESFDEALRILKENNLFNLYIENAMIKDFAFGDLPKCKRESEKISIARDKIKAKPFQHINTWLEIKSLFASDGAIDILQSSVFYISTEKF